jgi:predicted metal-dependent phosphoesterase TrpH
MVFKADLHTHTTCSDGTLTPSQLLYLSHEMGLSGLSITDHDTISAYTSDLFVLAESLKIRLKTGVELSAGYQGESVHVLGYSFPWDSEVMKDFCDQHQKRRHHRTLAMLEKLRLEGILIEEKDLVGEGTIGRPHIAEQMVIKGYVKTMKEAFQRYLGDQQSCYVMGEIFSVQETIDVIHSVGGKAFLAHPALIKGHRTLNNLLAMNFDGLESDYGNFSLDVKERWRKVAKQYKLLTSGGSDFHGSRSPDTPLGASTIDEVLFASF